MAVRRDARQAEYLDSLVARQTTVHQFDQLALARLTLAPGNFRLLDEPTNPLDLPAREALEDALARYDGSLLVVSPDRYFIRKVANRVLAIAEGRLRPAAGTASASPGSTT